jgi:hypothetical protein
MKAMRDSGVTWEVEVRWQSSEALMHTQTHLNLHRNKSVSLLVFQERG